MPFESDRSKAPAKFFGKGDALYVQAQQIWLILTGFVMMRAFPAVDPKISRQLPEFIYYKELAELMGRPGAQNMLSRQLGIVGHYCVLNGLPPLNVIVVNKTSEMPGDEVVLRQGCGVREEMKAVSEYNWFDVRAPTIGAFRKVYDLINAR